MYFSTAAPGRPSRRILPPVAVLALAVLLTSLAAPSSSLAARAPRQFIALLNGPQETPPTASTAQGLAHFTYVDATKKLCFSISYTGLSSAEIQAHLHGPSLPGVAAAVIYDLPPGSVKSGCVGPFTAALKVALLKNQLYIDVHSASSTGGEIRGQILRIK